MSAEMGWSPDLGSLRHRLVAGLRNRLRIDARALAAFRIALGALLVADLAGRSRDLVAFYTDRGVLPRSAHVATADPAHPSLHLLSGEAWVQAGLFLVAGVLAIAFLVGYRTRIATVGSWLLLVSLHNRLPDVLNGGDVLLRLLVFWAMFLPLGARWAVDATHRDTSRSDVLSVAGVALLAQVVIVYLTNGAMKLNGDVWLSGDGLEYVFSLGQFIVGLGDVLAGYAGLLWPLDYLWLAMITLSVLLVLLPGYWRVGFVSLFVAAHVGMFLTMQLGLFPFVSIASLLPFLPPVFWDDLASRFGGRRPVAALRRTRDRLAAILPRVTVTDVPASLARARAVALTVVPLIFLVLVVLWNLQFLGYDEFVGTDVAPDEAEWVMHLTRTDQYWNMFAPDPLSTDGWLVAPGVLQNGSRVDTFHGGAPTWDRPPDVSATYPNARWRKYAANLYRHTADRQSFARYLCDRWDRHHDGRLRNVSVTYVAQPTRLDEPEPTERVHLASARC